MIQDNYLDKDSFEKIQATMLGNEFPWVYNNFVVDSNNQDDLYDYQFVHRFYYGFSPRSPYYEMLIPLLHKLNPSAIFRIKANLNPCTPEHKFFDGMHVDYDNIDGKVAIFYVNTNNGYTLLEDGTQIASVENRLITMDNTVRHTGISCTDRKVRCVININYI